MQDIPSLMQTLMQRSGGVSRLLSRPKQISGGSAHQFFRQEYCAHAQHKTQTHINQRGRNPSAADQLKALQRKSGKRGKSAADPGFRKQHPFGTRQAVFYRKYGNQADRKSSNQINQKRPQRKSAFLPGDHCSQQKTANCSNCAACSDGKYFIHILRSISFPRPVSASVLRGLPVSVAGPVPASVLRGLPVSATGPGSGFCSPRPPVSVTGPVPASVLRGLPVPAVPAGSGASVHILSVCGSPARTAEAARSY
jgi:hypothetical protein